MDSAEGTRREQQLTLSRALLVAALAVTWIPFADAASIKIETQYNTSAEQLQGKGAIDDTFGKINLELEGTATEDESKEPFVNSGAIKIGIPVIGSYFNVLPHIELGYGSTPKGTGVDSMFWGLEIRSEQPTFVVPNLNSVVGYRYRNAFGCDLDFHTSRIEAGLVYHLENGDDLGASYYRANWNTNMGGDVGTNAIGVSYALRY